MFHKIGKKYRETALIKLIIVGLILGIIIALAAPQAVPAVSVLGDLFVRALKGIAPVLVFVLVMNALAQKNSDASASMKPIVRLYVFATFCASLVAVAYSLRSRRSCTCRLPMRSSRHRPASSRSCTT